MMKNCDVGKFGNSKNRSSKKKEGKWRKKNETSKLRYRKLWKTWSSSFVDSGTRARWNRTEQKKCKIKKKSRRGVFTFMVNLECLFCIFLLYVFLFYFCSFVKSNGFDSLARSFSLFLIIIFFLLFCVDWIELDPWPLNLLFCSSLFSMCGIGLLAVNLITCEVGRFSCFLFGAFQCKGGSVFDLWVTAFLTWNFTIW